MHTFAFIATFAINNDAYNIIYNPINSTIKNDVTKNDINNIIYTRMLYFFQSPLPSYKQKTFIQLKKVYIQTILLGQLLITI